MTAVEGHDEKKVEIITLELSALPRNLDEAELKRDILQNQHVVRLDAQKDNITGICNGKGRVQIRCSNQANATEIIDRFAQRGIRAQVKS